MDASPVLHGVAGLADGGLDGPVNQISDLKDAAGLGIFSLMLTAACLPNNGAVVEGGLRQVSGLNPLTGSQISDR
jgi:hypothetical protein